MNDIKNPTFQIMESITIPASEIEITFVCSSGPGGQNVNRVATAVHLRFDIGSSSLPELCKSRLLKIKDRRINSEGIIVIKARNYRTQAGNRKEALDRLRELIQKSLKVQKKRKMTRPTIHSVTDRLNSKKRRAEIKKMRKKIEPD